MEPMQGRGGKKDRERKREREGQRDREREREKEGHNEVTNDKGREPALMSFVGT